MLEKPTLMFVPGAWHGPEFFDITREKLEKLGYPTRAVRNPTHLGKEDPAKVFEHDVANLRIELESLIKDGKYIVVIPHSYGGLIASCAVEGLDFNTQRRKGLKSGVIAVGYVTAFALPKGMTMTGLVRPEGGESHLTVADGDRTRALNIQQNFYHDLHPTEQDKWASTLKYTHSSVFVSESTYEPWHDIPCTYVFCKEDRAIDISIQRNMVARWGQDVTTFEYNSSHSPFLSKPDQLVDSIETTTSIGMRNLKRSKL